MIICSGAKPFDVFRRTGIVELLRISETAAGLRRPANK